MRARVLTAMLAAGVIPLALVYIFTNVWTLKQIHNGEMARMEQMTHQLTYQIEQLLLRVGTDVTSLSQDSVIRRGGADLAPVSEVMRQFAALHHMFKSISLLDKNGKVLRTDTATPETEDTERWVARALKGEPCLGPPRRIAHFEGLYMSVYFPVPDVAGQGPGVIRADLAFDDVWKIFEGGQQGRHRDLVLLDRKNSVLASPAADSILKTFSRGLPADGVWQPTGILRGTDGVEYTYASSKVAVEDLPVIDWTVVWLTPTEELARPVEHTKRMVLAASLMAVLLAAGIGLSLTRAVTGSALRLSGAARLAARGNLTAEVPVSGPREMRETARVFNEMMGELALNRAGLEEIVDQRTRSLAESREALRKLTIQLRAAYEAVPEAILVIGGDGVVLEASRKMERFFGLAPERLAGQPFSKAYAEFRGCFAEPHQVDLQWSQLEETPDAAVAEEWALADRPAGPGAGAGAGAGTGGGVFEVYTSPVVDASGAPFARLWMFRDITVRRKLERSLQQAQKMEAVGQLAGGVAHDFNNLLTAIDGHLSLLAMDGETSLGPRGSVSLQNARQAAERAAGLVRGLLGYSRRSHLRRQRCNANTLVRRTVERLRPALDPRIDVRLALAAELPDFSADGEQLPRILANLCRNAADAMPRGGRLTIRTSAGMARPEDPAARQTAGGGERLCVSIEIADTGHGMTEEVRRRVFEPFFTTRGQGKGTGLGLAMAYGIVRQHDGWIECRTAPDEGTVITVRIPADAVVPPQDADDPPTVDEPPALPAADLRKNRRLRVLVVDDEAVVRAVAEGMLRHLGHAILTADNGRHAVDRCEEAKGAFDLVLMDMTMPVMSGHEAFLEIHARFPGLPVVFCSGYSLDMDTMESGGKPRPAGVIQKPYTIARLQSVLESLPVMRAAEASAAGVS